MSHVLRLLVVSAATLLLSFVTRDGDLLLAVFDISVAFPELVVLVTVPLVFLVVIATAVDSFVSTFFAVFFNFALSFDATVVFITDDGLAVFPDFKGFSCLCTQLR